MSKIGGSCLCGKVTYEVEGPAKIFQYCHCSRCRKFTGSAHGSNMIVAPEQFNWLSGAEHVRQYDLPGAKYFSTAFCDVCGSSLPWMAQGGKAVVIPAGTLDENPGEQPIQSIYWDSHAEWYLSPEQLPKHAELPPRKK